MREPATPLLAIKALNNQIKRMLDNNVTAGERGGLTGMQCAVLGFLGGQNSQRDIFQKDIEKAFNVRRSTATGILQLLEKNGFLYREPVPGDARLKKIVLTEKGRAGYRNSRERILKFNELATDGLSPQEMESFIQTIKKISGNIDHINAIDSK